MSLTITTDIFCDYCPQWVHGVCHSYKIMVREALRQAKAEGWKRIKGKDICPKCQEQLKELEGEDGSNT